MARSNFVVRGGADFSGIKREMQKTTTALGSFSNRIQNNLKTGTQKIQKTFTGFQNRAQSSFKKSFSIISKIIAAAFTVKAISGLAKEFMEAQSAADRLAKVLQNTIGATRTQISAVMSLTDAYQQVGVISNSIQQAGLQELGTYLSETSSIKKLLPTLNDMLAQQYGYNATMEQSITVATMLGKVMNGQVGALRRYGYTFDEAQEKILKFGTEEQRAAVLADVVAESVGGMNEALGRTPIGRITQLKNNFSQLRATLGQTFVTLFSPLVNILNTVILKLNTIFVLINSLLGRKLNVSFDMPENNFSGMEVLADEATDAANAIDGVGESAKKAKKALAGFDEVNTLSFAESSGASGGAGTGGGISEGGVFDIDDMIEDVEGTPFDFITEKIELIKSALEPTITAFKNLWSVLGLVKDFSFRALYDFYSDFLKPVGKWVFGEGLPRFFNALYELVNGINWSYLNDCLSRLFSALAPFAINVGKGLLWFWENVLVPFGAWAINNVVTLFLEALAKVISILNGVIEALKPLALWLWNAFLEPLAKWTGGVIISVLELVVGALGKFSDWILSNQAAIRTITVSVGLFFAAWKVTQLLAFIQISGGLAVAFSTIAKAIKAATLAKIVDKAETLYLTALYAKDFIISVAKGTAELVKQCAQWVITTGLKVADTAAQIAMTAATVAWNAAASIGTAVTTAFGAAVAFLTSPITLVVLAIGALIAIIVLLVKNWDTVKEVAIKVWEGIKTAWSTASNWMNDKVVKPIAGFFKGLWDGIGSGLNTIKQAFSNIFEGIVGIVKKPVNVIIGFLNGLISGIVGGVNTVINAVNRIKVDVPDWLPGIGGKSIGFNLTPLTAFKIPMLAKGGVVDSPTLAMIGERGKEAVVPLENNTGFLDKLGTVVANAVIAALNTPNASQQAGRNIILELDGTQFARSAVPYLKDELKRMGVALTW